MIKRYIGVSLVTAAMLLAGCSSSDDDNPATTDGAATDGAATDGAATDGAATDGAATDGAATDGAATDGAATDGAATDGAATDGAATDGAATDGAATDGAATDGAATDGGTTDGATTDGGTGGDFAADAAALQAFLTNSTAAADDFEIWTCTQGSDSATGTRGYRFDAIDAGATSGTGFRREAPDGSNDLNYSWSVTDNTAVQITFVGGGADGTQEDLTSIQINESPRGFTADSNNLGTSLACAADAVSS